MLLYVSSNRSVENIFSYKIQFNPIEFIMDYVPNFNYSLYYNNYVFLNLLFCCEYYWLCSAIKKKNLTFIKLL